MDHFDNAFLFTDLWNFFPKWKFFPKIEKYFLENKNNAYLCGCMMVKRP